MNYQTEQAAMTAESRMGASWVQEVNARLFFQSGFSRPKRELRPWQYVQMEYQRMELTPPAYIPPLETMEDAEIWMCLDERVNRSVRMRESSIAG